MLTWLIIIAYVFPRVPRRKKLTLVLASRKGVVSEELKKPDPVGKDKQLPTSLGSLTRFLVHRAYKWYLSVVVEPMNKSLQYWVRNSTATRLPIVRSRWK